MLNKPKRIIKPVTSWATVDSADGPETAKFLLGEDRKAAGRVKIAVRNLQDAGLVDSSGRRVKKDLPDEMRESSGYLPV